MIGIDELCIIASCLAKTGHKEASDLAVLSSELLTYEPLWGILKDEPGPSGRTRLMYCAKYGKTGRLRWLLKRGANPDLQDYKGYSALLLGSLNGHYESVVELCRAGAKVDIATFQDGYTPLMAAAAWGHEAIVLELCRRAADTEAQQKGSGSLAPEGMEHVMEERIGKRRADWWNDSTWASTEGATALLLACGMGRTTVVHDLCWEGRADVNAKTLDEGMTCMMFAAAHGETEIVRQLVYRGADIHAKKKNGSTALMFAATKGHPETVQLLCEVGADIAAIDTECMNALSLACSTGCAKSVDALCRAGASLDAVPGAYEGMSPLMFAIRSRSMECVRILCAAGADVDATMACGITAPMMAISHYSPDILRFLLHTDVDIRVVSGYYGQTAMHRATELGDVESLRILIDAGLSINERTVDGKTPLMLAAGQINCDIVRILCELGADIEARDTKGLTAMDYALITKCTGSAIILQKFGAKIPRVSGR